MEDFCENNFSDGWRAVQPAGPEPRVFANSVPLLQETYVGQAYAAPTAECRAAIRRLAQVEGLLLDPIYTGKAFTGLLDLVENGRLGHDEPIIFLHTGGVIGLFA